MGVLLTLQKHRKNSKVNPADRPQSDLKLTQKWLQTPFLSHFWVTFGSLWAGTLEVTLESLVGDFNYFRVSVELGARPLLNESCNFFSVDSDLGTQRKTATALLVILNGNLSLSEYSREGFRVQLSRFFKRPCRATNITVDSQAVWLFCRDKLVGVHCRILLSICCFFGQNARNRNKIGFCKEEIKGTS